MYTRYVTLLRRGVATLVLLMLAGSPVLGSVCEALCAPGGSAAPAADTGHSHCHEEGATAVDGRSLGANPIHRCAHERSHAGITPALSTLRADTTVRLAAAAHVGEDASIPGSPLDRFPAPGHGPPISPPAPPRAPLVLRI